MRFEDQRKLLVEELVAYGINDEKVLSAFLSVPREYYVLPEYKEYAYRNQPLPILQKQTISQPLMIAIMMQHLELNENDSVLEIGTGSGYQSALLAGIVKEVCTIERIEELSLKAQNILKGQGFKNIYYRIGDGADGWVKAYPPRARFSKIIISAAAEQIPNQVVNQLGEGGIMVVPVGTGAYQVLTKLTNKQGSISISEHGACAFVPLVTEK